MIPDIDIWRSANVMIKRYGETAALEASMRADELMESGDMEGARVWMRIIEAIEKLVKETPEEGERVH
jgi:triphosphoribosyl-dephospho-CoA synthetase